LVYVADGGCLGVVAQFLMDKQERSRNQESLFLRYMQLPQLPVMADLLHLSYDLSGASPVRTSAGMCE
jgi:hypothetical protein